MVKQGMSNEILSPLVGEIRDILDMARKNVVREVNNELIVSYWKIGEIIVRYEQNDSIRAEYGEQTLKLLAKSLTAEFGKGFSRANIYNMRLFYQTYQKIQTVSGKLSWSHYCELLSISDEDKRRFYEKDILGEIYEYLIKQFAASAGKKGGNFVHHMKSARF